jgi:hypothetical protein
MFQLCEAQPGLSGNPFLWLEKRRQKDWERKTEIAAQKIVISIMFNVQKKPDSN